MLAITPKRRFATRRLHALGREHSDTPLAPPAGGPSAGKASRAAPTPPARLPSIRGLAVRPWAARATPSSRLTICSRREATWRVAPAAGTSCRTLTYLQPDASRALLRFVLLGGPRRKARYDFNYGNLEPGTFPAAAWRAITDDILLSVKPPAATPPQHPFGRRGLRGACGWVTQRDTIAPPEQIVVQGGTQRPAFGEPTDPLRAARDTRGHGRNTAATACARS